MKKVPLPFAVPKTCRHMWMLCDDIGPVVVLKVQGRPVLEHTSVVEDFDWGNESALVNWIHGVLEQILEDCQPEEK